MRLPLGNKTSFPDAMPKEPILVSHKAREREKDSLLSPNLTVPRAPIKRTTATIKVLISNTEEVAEAGTEVGIVNTVLDLTDPTKATTTEIMPGTGVETENVVGTNVTPENGPENVPRDGLENGLETATDPETGNGTEPGTETGNAAATEIATAMDTAIETGNAAGIVTETETETATTATKTETATIATAIDTAIETGNAAGTGDRDGSRETSGSKSWRRWRTGRQTRSHPGTAQSMSTSQRSRVVIKSCGANIDGEHMCFMPAS